MTTFFFKFVYNWVASGTGVIYGMALNISRIFRASSKRFENGKEKRICYWRKAGSWWWNWGEDEDVMMDCIVWWDREKALLPTLPRSTISSVSSHSLFCSPGGNYCRRDQENIIIIIIYTIAFMQMIYNADVLLMLLCKRHILITVCKCICLLQFMLISEHDI